MKLWPAAVAAAAALMVGGDTRRGGEAPKGSALEAAAELVLRVAPDGGAPVRGTLAAGAKVTVGVRQGNWALIRSGEGENATWGWAVEPELKASKAE